MKIKTEFVTNSSSSSFVVVWPKLIKTIEDVKLFIEEKFCNTVFDDAISQKPLSLKRASTHIKITDMVKNGYIDYCSNLPDIWDYEDVVLKRESLSSEEYSKIPVWRMQMWHEEDIKRDIEAGICSQKFLDEIGEMDGYIYIFQYADEDGEYFSELEHGGTFRKLKHIQISHH